MINAVLLRVLVRKLMDNAIRYAGVGAQIVVKIVEDENRFAMSIDDSGPGLTAKERTELGVRFYRKCGMSESGSGLGWSICERVCQAHGFTLQAEDSTSLGGLSVHVSGPRAS